MRYFLCSILLLSLAVLCHAENPEWESSFTKTEDLSSWTKYGNAKMKEDGLYISNTNSSNGMYGIWKELPPAHFKGKMILFSGERKGIGIAPAEKDYLGPKLMLVITSGTKIKYSDVPPKFGNYDWCGFENIIYIPDDADKIRLFLGFQNGCGNMGIRSLKIEILASPLDLSPYANMNWTDDHADDGKGGWSDQGSGMDGEAFILPLSKGKIFAGVPFSIRRKDKSIICMKSNRIKNGLQEFEITFASPCEAKYLYLLHCLCWAPQEKLEAGKILIEYKDGKEETITLKAGEDVGDWWNSKELPNGAIGLRARARDGEWRGLYVSKFALKNQNSEIKTIRFEAGNPDLLWIICAATLSDKPFKMPLPREKVKTTIMPSENWIPITREDFNRRKSGSALDLSSFMDKTPVGSHGRVIIREDGHFAFEKRPHQIQRFFSAGINFKLENRLQADQLADELLKNGYNMVRIHIPENTLMYGAGKKLQFNAHYLDIFDYLTAALKKRGIYMMCDMAGSIVNGWDAFKIDYWGAPISDKTKIRKRLSIHFDPEARDEWSKGIEQLLCRVNPYTQTRLIDDPVLVMVLGYNEQEFEFSRNFDQDFVAPYYREFLKRKYASIESYNSKWKTEYHDFDKIPCFQSRESGNSDVREFLYKTEKNTAAWYKSQVQELGYQGLISSYNVFKTHHFNQIRNETCDYIAMNSYHAHPTNWIHIPSEISQDSAISKSAGLFRDIISGRIQGKPLVVTEYQCVYWNKYRYEQPFVFGAYASLQGLDAISMHSEPVSLKSMLTKDSKIRAFSGYTDPIAIASEFLTYFLYMRGDITPLKENVHVLLPEIDYEGKNPNLTISKTQNALALICGFSLTYDKMKKAEHILFSLKGDVKTEGTEAFSQSVDETANLMPYLQILKTQGFLKQENKSNGINIFESANGEIFMDTDKNFMSINTPRFQGICSEAGSSCRLNNFEIESMSVDANLSLVSIDGHEDIFNSKRLMLVFASNALSNQMVFAEEEMLKLLHSGEAPSLIRSGSFQVKIKNRQAASLKLYPLDLAGTRLKEIRPAHIEGEYARFKVDTQKDGAAVFFEISQ